MTDLPIRGMTRRPDSCDGFEPALGWPGFRGCVEWALSEPKIRAEFEAATGKNISYMFTRRTPFEKMIDESSGRDGQVFAAFADWVCVEIWGEEESP